MIWAIVYGGLALITIGVLSVPTVRIAKEVRALGRTMAESGRRLEEAFNRLDDASRDR